MQMGFNNDVRHRGLVVHIQTEDHGLRSKKVTTQVFFSGAVLDSRTMSYEESIANIDDVAECEAVIVRQMKTMHAHFRRQILNGAYDAGLPLDDDEELPTPGARGGSAGQLRINEDSSHREITGGHTPPPMPAAPSARDMQPEVVLDELPDVPDLTSDVTIGDGVAARLSSAPTDGNANPLSGGDELLEDVEHKIYRATRAVPPLTSVTYSSTPAFRWLEDDRAASLAAAFHSALS